MKVRDLLKALRDAPQDLELSVIDTDAIEYQIKGFYAPVINGAGEEVADLEIERWQ